MMQVDPGVETALGADDATHVDKASKLAKGLYKSPQELKNHLDLNGISADMLAHSRATRKQTGALRMKKTLRSLCPREVRDADGARGWQTWCARRESTG